MSNDQATVTCPSCGLEETFEKLQAARTCIEDHRAETGHDPVWELHGFSEGVERAGDAAGVCGRPGSL